MGLELKKINRHLIQKNSRDEHQSALAVAVMKTLNAPETCFERDQDHYVTVVQSYEWGPAIGAHCGVVGVRL